MHIARFDSVKYTYCCDSCINIMFLIVTIMSFKQQYYYSIFSNTTTVFFGNTITVFSAILLQYFQKYYYSIFTNTTTVFSTILLLYFREFIITPEQMPGNASLLLQSSMLHIKQKINKVLSCLAL